MRSESVSINDAASSAAKGVLPLQRLYLPLVIILIASWTWRPLTGREDFWSHIAVGRWIWEHQSAPFETLWIWSAPSQSWIAHSWLSQLFLFAQMQAGGAHLVLLVTIILVALPFVWFWKLWARQATINALAPVFFALALLCAGSRFQPRPELFSYFFLSLLLLFLIEWPRHAGPIKSLVVIAIFALWANFHGGVALGIAIFSLTIVAELCQQKFAPPAWKLAALGCACILAVNLNPYGFAYWKTLTQVGGAMFKMIDEWKPPLAEPALPISHVALILVIAIIATLAWSRNPQRRWAQLLWLFFGCALFLTARRNLWPCILISVAVCSANAQGLGSLAWAKASLKTRLVAQTLAVAWLFFWILLAFSPEAISTGNTLPALRATASVLPRGVADAVLKERLPDPIFNDYLRSGYFQWRFYGERKLYIDLQNVYPPSLLENYFAIIARTDKGRKEFDRLKINTVIFGSYREKDRIAPLARYLDSQSKIWMPIYHGKDGAIWVRRSAMKKSWPKNKTQQRARR